MSHGIHFWGKQAGTHSVPKRKSLEWRVLKGVSCWDLRNLIILLVANEFLLSFKLIQTHTTYVQYTDITYMCQQLTSVNIRKVFTTPELSYVIIFILKSRVTL
jgi:hypothetical protein